jgi:hypothetical protein
MGDQVDAETLEQFFMRPSSKPAAGRPVEHEDREPIRITPRREREPSVVRCLECPERLAHGLHLEPYSRLLDQTSRRAWSVRAERLG